MDIDEYKKYAIPKIEAGKMVNIVRKAIKEAEYTKQDKDDVQKEIFKPITQELKNEIDEISDLREEFIKVNKPITYIPEQQALTQEKKLSNLDAGFSDKDKDILEQYQLPNPSDLFTESLYDDDIVPHISNESAKINKKLGLEKAQLAQTKIKREKDKDKIDLYTDAIETIKKYRLRIGVIEEGKKTLQAGKGIYTQQKRNAYKINQKTGEYGTLNISMPKLLGQLKLIAYKDGKKIDDKNVDFDTIDLFTKRYNGKKKYSDLSRSVFNDINELSEIPIHKTSKKYKIGSGVVYYNNPQDLLKRLELLAGSIMAGNSSSTLKNEFSEIAHVLKKINILTNDQLKNLLKNYVL